MTSDAHAVLKKFLQKSFIVTISFFTNEWINQADKCHVMTSSTNYARIETPDTDIKSKRRTKPVCINNDSNLNSD